MHYKYVENCFGCGKYTNMHLKRCAEFITLHLGDQQQSPPLILKGGLRYCI